MEWYSETDRSFRRLPKIFKVCSNVQPILVGRPINRDWDSVGGKENLSVLT